MNFIEPAHLQGVIKGFPSSSVSSKQILQALPLSSPAPLMLSFSPPIIFSFAPFIPLLRITLNECVLLCEGYLGRLIPVLKLLVLCSVIKVREHVVSIEAHVFVESCGVDCKLGDIVCAVSSPRH